MPGIAAPPDPVAKETYRNAAERMWRETAATQPARYVPRCADCQDLSHCVAIESEENTKRSVERTGSESLTDHCQPGRSWVAGALAMELRLPAGIEPDLVTVDVDGVQLCRAEALVVFGHRPHLFLPGMAVLASGPSERRFEGSLNELLDAVETWTPATMDARITRAAVLYALTHRSLEIADRAFPIQVELGERLVVRFPPGGNGLAAQLAVAASHARDPLLDIEVWGGRPRLRDGVLTVGLPAPAKQPYLAAEERERQVIDLLRPEAPLSTASMLEQLGWTRSSLRRVLAGLVASGTIETELATQSPGQRYRLPG